MTETTVKEIEVLKLNLDPDDVLIVTVKSDRDPGAGLEHFAKIVSEMFPNNQVSVFGARKNDEIVFSVIKKPVENSCGIKSYCSDCSCGKKERNEAMDQLTAETEKLDLYKNDL
jgi:hypothetical protein